MKHFCDIRIFFITWMCIQPLGYSQPGGFYSPGGYHFNYISINQHKAWFGNNGLLFAKPLEGNSIRSASYWPGGENAYKSLAWSTLSMIWSGYFDTSFYYPKYHFNKNLMPGVPPSAGKNKDNRIYKIRKFWESMPFNEFRNTFELDFNEWPVQKGAPWEDIDNNGIFTKGIDKPLFVGDETLWFTVSDIDTQSNFSSNSGYSGFEEQYTIYGFNRGNFLQDAIFFDVKIVNHGNAVFDSMTIYTTSGFFSLVDTSKHSRFYYDSTLRMIGYYFRNNDSYEYSPPPAAGIVILNASNSFLNTINLLSVNTSAIYDTSVYSFDGITFADQIYHLSRGRHANGSPIVNPLTGDTTRFIFTGDPISGTGWNYASGLGPGILRYGNNANFSLGPVTFNPSDTIHIVLAVIAAQGTDNMNSLELLRQRAKLLKRAYENNFLTPPAPPSPEVKIYEEEGKVT
ncbi:MAG: hypothetical protein L6Q47_17290, partial [Ignavibacteriaceae bacterium]|nr:hypothetical protein [Ignavibacteriaceae bacterium]